VSTNAIPIAFRWLSQEKHLLRVFLYLDVF